MDGDVETDNSPIYRVQKYVPSSIGHYTKSIWIACYYRSSKQSYILKIQIVFIVYVLEQKNIKVVRYSVTVTLPIQLLLSSQVIMVMITTFKTYFSSVCFFDLFFFFCFLLE